MTTIVATRTALFADSQCTAAPAFSTSKLFRIQHEDEVYLCGMAGGLDEGHFLIRLLEKAGLHGLWQFHLKPEGRDLMPDWLLEDDFGTNLLIVTQDKRIWLLGERLIPLELNVKAHAIGSGCDWALAALDHGKSPQEAVEYACTRDPYSKGPVQRLTFKS